MTYHHHGVVSLLPFRKIGRFAIAVFSVAFVEVRRLPSLNLSFPFLEGCSSRIVEVLNKPKPAG